MICVTKSVNSSVTLHITLCVKIRTNKMFETFLCNVVFSIKYLKLTAYVYFKIVARELLMGHRSVKHDS